MLVHALEDKLYIICTNEIDRPLYFHFMQEIYILAADEWEISPDDLELQEKLGKGQFGDVKLALVKNMSCTSKLRNYVDRQVAGGESLSTSRAVAVKYLRG